jgi:DNA polymerase-3 subunit epsilon
LPKTARVERVFGTLAAVARLDLATPLYDVTFVVVDLETTGTAPGSDAITEIGALKLRGGEVLGRFESLVQPGEAVHPFVSALTGITDAMLAPAPNVQQVLPSFLEFLGNAVVVGHNVRFDCSFLDAALVAHDYSPLDNWRVDTVALARRLVCDETVNHKLATLAHHFHASVEPVHRAYADAAATADLLHALLERAAFYGAFGLDDLLTLPSMRAHTSSAKLSLTAHLPRTPGVYQFRDRRSEVLYVGAAANLRGRVRSYFAADGRRTVPQLVRSLTRIDHEVFGTEPEAELRRAELVERLRPRYNRPGREPTVPEPVYAEQ